MKKLMILLGLASMTLTGCIIRERHPRHTTVIVEEHHRHW